MALRSATSWLINAFMTGVRIQDAGDHAELEVPEELEVRMHFLQRLVWYHVIESPSLATQQHGQREIVRRLFEIYLTAVRNRKNLVSIDRAVIPASFRTQVDQLDTDDSSESLESREVRIAVDIVASLSDTQAVTLFRRLTGVAAGSIMDLVDH